MRYGFRDGFRPNWRDPGYWRWLWQTRFSNGTRLTIAALVGVTAGIAGYAGADWLQRPDAASGTTQRVVTVLRTVRAEAAPQVTTNTAPSPSPSARVRINILSVSPPSPQAAQRFELVARVSFAPASGAIRCNVWIAGKPYRNVRLTWNTPIARCFFRVPNGTRGQRLQIRVSATLRNTGARTTLPFTVS